LERGSYDKSNELYSKNTRVYDLEIEGNHNYFVNGVLVSNCHFLKQKDALRTKTFNDFSTSVKKLWLLTGTPITNRPMDFYNLLSLAQHRIARNWVGFVIRYCAGRQFFGKGGRKIWDTKGSSNLDELREFTTDVILRRRKEEVLDLPEKIIQPLYLPLRNKREYEQIVGEYRSWAEHQKTVNLSLHIATILYVNIEKQELTFFKQSGGGGKGH
jgi:SNF2 family DNA or RNA helicase